MGGVATGGIYQVRAAEHRGKLQRKRRNETIVKERPRDCEVLCTVAAELLISSISEEFLPLNKRRLELFHHFPNLGQIQLYRILHANNPPSPLKLSRL